jgi:hypothetical protein
VSLLERLGRGHLSETTFARLWTEDAGADGAPTHPHLGTCAACRARYEEFSTWMADIGDELRHEAEAAFTAERLAVQQSQIARRLEAIDRPARVIAFPKAARAVISGHSHVRRWVTVAAAASLIAGFGLGQFVPLRTTVRHEQAPVTAALTLPQTREIAKDIPPVTITEEELLSNSFTRSHLSTLSALDDMTPHARDTVLDHRGK